MENAKSNGLEPHKPPVAEISEKEGRAEKGKETRKKAKCNENDAARARSKARVQGTWNEDCKMKHAEEKESS